MKNAFYFILKALFIFKIFKFYLDFMTLQPGKQATAIPILPNISTSKGNQTKIMHKMWWRNYSQTLFQKIKIEHFSGLTV